MITITCAVNQQSGLKFFWVIGGGTLLRKKCARGNIAIEVSVNLKTRRRMTFYREECTAEGKRLDSHDN